MDNPAGPQPARVPDSGDAGRFTGRWFVYAPGDVIRCPGTKPDRRAEFRGERRLVERPCPQHWGRAGEDVEVHIRLKPLHPTEGVLTGQLVGCPECSRTVQIRHVPAAKAA